MLRRTAEFQQLRYPLHFSIANFPDIVDSNSEVPATCNNIANEATRLEGVRDRATGRIHSARMLA